MQKLSEDRRTHLLTATEKYRQQLTGSPAEEYLQSRGLLVPEAGTFGLGYVGEPAAGHEGYRGMLSIPYRRYSPWRGWSVASIRFRRLDGGSPKYLGVAGDQPRLFNTPVLLDRSPVIGVAEGEIDAMTACIAGVPTIGVPGVQLWKPYFADPLFGYREVFVFADGDEPGAAFAASVARQLPNAKVIPFPDGQDVNSFVQKYGPEALRGKLK